MSTDLTTLRDMMGNELRPGDTFVYAAMRFRSVGMRIGKVRPNGSLHIVCPGMVRTPEGGYTPGWAKMSGRPTSSQLIKVPAEHLNAQVLEALES